MKGRESRADITYDHARGRVEYHFKGETFFLRRLRRRVGNRPRLLPSICNDS